MSINLYFKNKLVKNKGSLTFFINKEGKVQKDFFTNLEKAKAIYGLSELSSDDLFIIILEEFILKNQKTIIKFLKSVGEHNFCLQRFYKFREFVENNLSYGEEFYKLKYGNEWEAYYNNYKNNIGKNYDPQYYIKKYNISEEEAKEKVRQIKIQTSSSLESYIQKYGREIGIEKYEEFCKKSAMTLENMIRLYGVEKGQDEYNKNLVTRSKQNTLDRFVERFGKELGLEKYNKANSNKSSGGSLQGQIDKYGLEEGTRRYELFNAKKAYGQTLEWHIERYGLTDGQIKYKALNKKKGASNTYIHYVSTYGEELGKRKYLEYLENCSAAFRKGSKESLKIFSRLKIYLLNKGYLESDIYLGDESGLEYSLIDTKLFKKYYYDFTILNKKIIIEYNGIKFHPKKHVLSEEEWDNWRSIYSKMTANEVYKHDIRKKYIAEENGFNYYTLWSDEKYTISNIIKDLKL